MLRSLAVALLSTGAALAAVKTQGSLDLKNAEATIPGAFIVELSSSSTKRTADVHEDFLAELDKRAAGKFATRKKYDSPLFNGIAVQLHNPEDLASLETIPNIVAVHPIRILKAPVPVAQHVLSGPDDPEAIPFGQSTHYMTGVDHVHEQGFAGKGIKIAIIDTGIDYTHPSLGGAFGPGNKIAGGYDFVGDDYAGTEPPIPDDDPLDTCIGHGTHVAGIIGANPDNPYNVSGVAHEATLLAYRVFSCNGVTSDDVLVDALLRAYSDGADVINLSLGKASGWASDTLATVASRIADRGRVITASAGNDGRSGAAYLPSPASGENVISVASIENIKTLHPALISSVEHPPIPYDDAVYGHMKGQPIPLEDKPYTLISPSTDPYADDMACALAEGTDYSQHAVIIRQSKSTCPFINQLFWLLYAKTKLLIVYDIGVPFLLDNFFNVVILKNNTDGYFLVSELAKSNNITVRFPQGTGGVELPNDEVGGLASYFTTYGPSNDLLFGPSLAAPGGNITSTYLTNHGSWAVQSGTSMASPYIAGSAALLLQAKGKAVAKKMRSLLQAGSIHVPFSKKPGALPHSLAQVGTGLVNVFQSLSVKTEVFPTELLLNDTAHWQGSHKITIRNTRKEAQTYELTHQPANTVISLDSGAINYRYYTDISQTNAPASVHLSVSSVTVQPGHFATVVATITPPEDVDPKLLPIVSGSIILSGSQGDIVKVSYMGVAGSLRDAQSISTGNGLLVEGGLPAIVLRAPTTLYPQRGPANYTRGSMPGFAFMMAQASRHVTLELIDAASNITSTIPDPLDAFAKAKTKRGADWSKWSSWWPGSDAETPIETVGLIAEGIDTPRDARFLDSGVTPYAYLNPFPTTFANGSQVPLGQYKILLRSLRLDGNPRVPADWDVYVSQQIGIVEDAPPEA